MMTSSHHRLESKKQAKAHIHDAIMGTGKQTSRAVESHWRRACRTPAAVAARQSANGDEKSPCMRASRAPARGGSGARARSGRTRGSPPLPRPCAARSRLPAAPRRSRADRAQAGAESASQLRSAGAVSAHPSPVPHSRSLLPPSVRSDKPGGDRRSARLGGLSA